MASTSDSGAFFKNCFEHPKDSPDSLFIKTYMLDKDMNVLIESFYRALRRDEPSLAKCYGYYIVEKAKRELDLIQSYTLMWDLYTAAQSKGTLF